MASRRARARKAELRKAVRAIEMAEAAKAHERDSIVRKNLSGPKPARYRHATRDDPLHTVWPSQSCVTMCLEGGAFRGGGFSAKVEKREKPRKRWS